MSQNPVAARRVRCPRCHNILEEPRAHVYQCGGCGTTIRAKIRPSVTEEVNNMFSPSRTRLSPLSRQYSRPIMNSPELQVDAALDLGVLEEPDAPVYQGQNLIDQLSKDAAKLQVDAAQVFEVPEGPSALVYQVSGRSTAEKYQRYRRKSGAQAYQESGCVTNLRAVTNAASTSRSGLPPRSRHCCRPILKGAPFIVCSICFKLLQVPINFAISTNAVGKLQCGSCSSVLTFSYRGLDRKKPYQDSVDQLSPDSSRLCCESYSKVEEPHYTPYEDAMAWLAMGKQRRKGLNHTFMQQVGRKLLGRDKIRQNIMKKILLDRADGSNCTVFCINGESGFGKTSMLSALYNDEELLYAFDKRIWIRMSDKFDVLMLFRKIIEFVMNDHCSIMSTDLLQELLLEAITNEKFLLILDDADIEDQQFWSSIFEVLNAGAKGSVVIMATKSCAGTPRDVTYFYFLNPLSEENKLMIFQQYSGLGSDTQNNPDLVMVAQRFISRFGSDPLNLKAICGLLCHTDAFSVEEDKFEGSVMPLRFCHDVLPVHLKQCLALCSLFPEGYIFDKHHMVLLWISHGCVRPIEGYELEDIGVEYFNELLCRSFFQCPPVHSDKDDMFVMHELMYNVVASVSCDKYFKSEDPMCSIPESIVHCSFISSQFQTVELMHRTEQLKDLQTFLAMQPEWKPNNISSLPTLNLVGLDDFFLKFTSLETLDLSHTETKELPGSIAGLRNLRYISVNNTNVRAFPSELCSLSNLQTIEAKHCRFLTELPRDIRRLVKLRHLDLVKELGYVDMPSGIGGLTELQTLPVLHVSEEPSRCSISELGNLQSLRGSLWLSGLGSVKTGNKAQEANLMYKHRLNDLTLQWHDDGMNIEGDLTLQWHDDGMNIEDEDEDQDGDAETVAHEQVLEGLQPHYNLQVLTIRGYEGSRFPAWMQDSSPALPNLLTLTLDSCCNCTEFPAIAHLPSLKSLSVRKMYDVRRLSSNTDTHDSLVKFPSLELLNLWEMYGLEELFSKESQGDCPRLRKVCISHCPDLKRLPRTPSLTELVLHCGQQLPDISELTSLVSLKIEGFHGTKSFGLPAAAALRKLDIRSCKELASMDGLSELTTVQRIKIAGCPKLVLPGLAGSCGAEEAGYQVLQGAVVGGGLRSQGAPRSSCQDLSAAVAPRKLDIRSCKELSSVDSCGAKEAGYQVLQGAVIGGRPVGADDHRGED